MPKFAKGATGGGGGGGGLMIGLFALQGVLGGVTSSYEQNKSAVEADTEEKIQALKESKKSYKQISSGIKALKEEGKARGEAKTAMEVLAEKAMLAANALITLSTLNMVTGGGLGKAGSFLMGKGGKAAKLTQAQNKARNAKELKQFRKNKASGMNSADANKAARSTVAKRGMMGTAAKRLGVVGSMGFGGYEAGSAYLDDSLEQEQKDERYKSAAGSTTGALVGGLIGSLLGPVGTVVGSAAGGYLGGKLGDSEGADSAVATRQKESFKEAQTFGMLDFNASDFQAAIEENLDAITAQDGFEAAANLQKAYDDALAAKAQLLDEAKQGEVSEKDRVAIQERLDQASMRLAGVRFKSAADESANIKAIAQTERKIVASSDALAKARKELADKTLDMAARVKREQSQGKLRTQLSQSVSGPFAGAVGLASEQNLMFRDINVAKNEKVNAEAALRAGQKIGVSGEELQDLKDAVSSAGENFESTVNKAAVSFKNKMVALEKGIADIDKQKAKLREKEVQASENFIQKVVAGNKGGGSLNFLMDSMTNLKAFTKDIQARKSAVERQGGTFEMTREEVRKLAQMQAAVQQGGENAGLSQNFSELIKKLAPELSKIFSGEGAMGAKARARAMFGDEESRAEFEGRYGKGAIDKILAGEGMSEKKAIDELTKTQEDLRAQLEITRKNYEKLNTDADTAALAANITNLATEMEMAARGLFELNDFSARITKTVTDTSGLITTNAAFVETQKGLISALTLELANLKIKVDDLSADSDLK